MPTGAKASSAASGTVGRSPVTGRLIRPPTRVPERRVEGLAGNARSSAGTPRRWTSISRSLSAVPPLARIAWSSVREPGRGPSPGATKAPPARTGGVARLLRGAGAPSGPSKRSKAGSASSGGLTSSSTLGVAPGVGRIAPVFRTAAEGLVEVCVGSRRQRVARADAVGRRTSSARSDPRPSRRPEPSMPRRAAGAAGP